MADPFQNVDAAGPEFITIFADAMDVRQSSPTMEKIVAAYLTHFSVDAESTVIEVGAGAGAVSRRIAAQLNPAQVVGFEPSEGFVAEARKRAKGLSNLRFEVANGDALPLENASVDGAVMHTVLSHVTDPSTLLAEVARVLKPNGTLIVCDMDFSKGSFASFPDDPLDACAKAFARGYVTDAYLIGKLRKLIADAGLDVGHFEMDNRLVLDGQQMRPWVLMTTKTMVDRGDIGAPLAEALLAEHDRRAEAGTLYGYQALGTVVARKPG